MSEIVTYPIVKTFYINVYNSATDPETNNTGKLYCGGFNAQNDSGYDFAFFLNRNIKETVIDGKIYKTCHASGHVEPDKAARVIQRYSVGNHHATLLNNIIPENSTYSLLTLCDSKGNLSKNHFSATSGGNSSGIKPYMGRYYIGTSSIAGYEMGTAVNLGTTNYNESYICGMHLNGTDYFGWVLLQRETNGEYIQFFTSFVSANYWENAEVVPFGNTTPGGTIGGYGTYDDTSDNFPIPPNRLNDVYGSILSNTAGKIQMYTLDSAAYNAFLGKIYTSDFWQYWQNTIFNPLDGIYSCIRVPFNELELTRSAVSKINVSNTELEILAGAYRVTNNFVKDQIIISNYAIEEYFGSFLDYSPYTTCELYIPFYGTVNIDINEIMGGNISITRRNNYVNGDFVVFVQCTNRFGVAVTHAYAGNAAMTLPITAGNDGSPNRILDLVQGVANLAMGNYVGAGTSAVNALTEKGTTSTVQKLSGGSGWNASHDFALIFRRVCQSNPENYTKENGRQADEFVKFSDLKGYTEVAAVDLKFTNGKITSSEIDEINNLLKQGVFF